MNKISLKISVILVGFGYWGKILARVVSDIAQVHIAGIIDPCVVDSSVDIGGCRIPVLRDMNAALRDINVNAVIISSPAVSHFAIARTALMHNKHVFIEKPMTLSLLDAKALVALAQKNKCMLFVDHTYVYSDAVMKMKRMIDHGDIGKVYAMESVRMNWGTARSDCSVIWDLAAHDIAIYRYFFGPPTRVWSKGFRYGGAGLPNRAAVYLENTQGVSGVFNVSWVYPKKIRCLTLIGTKGFLVMDESEAKGKILMYRNGLVKKVIGSDDTRKEPLRRACEDFVTCIQKGAMPRVSGSDGAAVVSVLEAADRSCRVKERWVIL